MKSKNLSGNLCFVFLILLIFSCRKEDINFQDTMINKVGTSGEESIAIWSFIDIKEYIEIRQKISNMSSTERKAYEESKKYKSFGRICDEFYDNINPEEFKSVEEIRTFVSLNSKYLKLIEEKNGEITVERAMYNDPTRYLINENKIYIIDKIAFKVYDTFSVSTDIKNIEILHSCNEEAIKLYEGKSDYEFSCMGNKQILIESKHFNPPAVFCGNYIEGVSVSGTDKTVLRLGWNKSWPNTNWMYETYFDIYAYKKALFWFAVKRTISWDVRWASAFISEGFDWTRIQHHYYGVTPNVEYSIHVLQPEFYTYQYTTADYHFDGFDGWGRTPSAPPIYISCTPENLE